MMDGSPHTPRLGAQILNRPCAWAGPLIRWVLIGLLVGVTLGSLGDDFAAAFERANKLYEQGKYAEAASGYEALLPQSKASHALFFNLGNALFKSGQVGRAILNYRLAERLAPRDPDIRANLRFARDSVDGAAGAPGGRWRRFLHTLSLNELSMLVTAAIWIWFGLLTVREVQPRLKPSLKGYTATAGVIAALAGLWLAALWQDRFQLESAVVVAKEAVVRYGPLEESQSFYTLHDGAEIMVLDHLNTWLQVRDASKRIGWVQAKQVAILPPG